MSVINFICKTKCAVHIRRILHWIVSFYHWGERFVCKLASDKGADWFKWFKGNPMIHRGGKARSGQRDCQWAPGGQVCHQAQPRTAQKSKVGTHNPKSHRPTGGVVSPNEWSGCIVSGVPHFTLCAQRVCAIYFSITLLSHLGKVKIVKNIPAYYS